MSNSLFLELKNATVWRGSHCVFRDLSLDLRMNESVAILGPNGAGKSSLIQLLTGGVRAQALPGTVCKIFGEGNYALEELRRKIGVVTAEDLKLINQSQIVEDLVLLAFRGAYGIMQQMEFSEAERESRDRILDRLNIGHLRSREFSCLSSGEKQCVLLARAMVHDPKVLIFDEPTSGLDLRSSLSFIQTMGELIKSGHTVLLITHHPSEISPEISNCILLKEGAVFAEGTKEEVLNSENLSHLFEIDLKLSFTKGWCQVIPD